MSYLDWINTGILAAGVAGSLFGGDGDNDAEEAAARNSDLQARIARALFKQSAPLRADTFTTLMGVLRGKRPLNLRVFAPEREALEAQYGNVREGILSSTDRGGLQQRLLNDARIARAQGVVGLESDVRRQAFGQALGIATGMPQIALGGLSSAAGTQAALAGINQQAQAAQGQNFGSLAALGLLGAGGLFGGGGGMS